MANSYGQFSLWVNVSYLLKSEPNCTSHKPRASYQRWQVHRGLQHGKCPHAATQSYASFAQEAVEMRERQAAAAAAKKEKDKQDRAKQKNQAEERKKKAQEKAAKGERKSGR